MAQAGPQLEDGRMMLTSTSLTYPEGDGEEPKSGFDLSRDPEALALDKLEEFIQDTREQPTWRG